MKKISIFFLKNYLFLVVKFSVYLNRRVLVMWLNVLQTGHLILGQHSLPITVSMASRIKLDK